MMWEKLSEIPVWYAEYLETFSGQAIEDLDITDVNAVWDLLMQ